MDTGIPRTVTLEGQPDANLREIFGIEPEITVLGSRVTAEHTAEIRVRLENVKAQPQTLFYTRETCDINLIVGQSQRNEDASLLLVSTEQAWDRVEDDCWVPDSRNLNCGIPAREHRITLEPGEPLDWSYRLWADPDDYRDGVCMPPGTYRFERAFRSDETTDDLSFRLSIDSG